jgi:hypothetical protein
MIFPPGDRSIFVFNANESKVRYLLTVHLVSNNTLTLIESC